MTKLLDKTSPKLFEQSLNGAHLSKASFTFTAIGKGEESTFLTYDLTTVLIADYAICSGGDWPSESVSMISGTILIKTSFLNGMPDSSTSSGWDLTKNVEL